MVKNSDTNFLNVFFNARYVGKLYSDNGSLSFAYSGRYLNEKNAVKLSASLPLQTEHFAHRPTSSFFSGLLPDERVRVYLARYLRVSEENTFALLREIGGECAGAVSLYEDGKTPNEHEAGDYKILKDKEAHKVLSAIDNRPMMVGEDDDIRISGAGAQDKLIITLIDGKIAIPLGGAPSTHIIKPNIKGLQGTVFNEFFCLRLAKLIGLPVPKVDVHWIEDEPYYLIERYDRYFDESGRIKRLHQEDFCQALGIAPENKYESEGGPTLKECFALLDGRIKQGKMAGINKLILLRGVIFNFIVGNGDAHGKNFSILYDGESEALAPFYDILNTVIYHDAFKSKMAMKIANKYKFKDVTARHFDKLAQTIGFKESLVKKEFHDLFEKILTNASVLRDDLNESPKTQSPIYDEIIKSFNKV